MGKRIILLCGVASLVSFCTTKELQDLDHQVTRIGIKIPEHVSDALDHLACALEKISESNVKTSITVDLTDHSKKTLHDVSSAMKKVTLSSENTFFVNTEWNQIDALWKRMCTAFVGCILSCVSAGYLNKNIYSLIHHKDFLHLFSTTISATLLYGGLFIIQNNNTALDLLGDRVKSWLKK